MTQQHTPGPWLRDGRFVYALGKGGTNIFSTNVQGGGSESDVATLAEQEANARLIAAAPRHLAALQDMVLANYDIRDFSAETLETLKEIRIALAEAKDE